MEGEWSCYRGQYNGGRIVMLRRWSVSWRENGHVKEGVTLIKGRMVMLQSWSVSGRENSYVTELASLMEGE